MRAKEARDIPIHEFLDGSGIKPALQRRSGKELWYSSPLRHGDSNPSFKVDTTKNLRFDFGLAQGGNVIDLVCLLTQSSVKEALAILDRSGLGAYSGYATRGSTTNGAKMYAKELQTALGVEEIISNEKAILKASLGEKTNVASEKEKSGLELIGVAELDSPLLLTYLQSRQIDLTVVKRYLKQVCFKSRRP